MANLGTWTPQREQLQQLAQYLSDSLSGRDPNTRKNAEVMLKQAKASPDINNYLCFLLSGSGGALQDVTLPQDSLLTARSAAGIMLKNDIKTYFESINPNSIAYIKDNILHGLQDESGQIRSFTGNVITELIRQAGVMGWPEVVGALLAMAANDGGSTTLKTQEGAMDAVKKVCEDNKRILSKRTNSHSPLEAMIPKFLELMSSPSSDVRAKAIGSLNIFVPEKSETILQALDTILARLFGLAEDLNDEVRRMVCRSLVSIAEVSPSRVIPHMKGLVQYMLTQQKEEAYPDLQLEAAEFFLFIGEDKSLRSSLEPYLATIVPVLLESMIYSEEDILRLDDEAEDAEEDDREQDIKPQFATSKAARFPGSKQEDVNGHDSTATAVTYADDDLSEGELEDYDSDDEDEDPEAAWNLRKCSAASLDTLASVFHKPVFDATLPYLMDNLQHELWQNREAAVLAIGAISEGCLDVVAPHLPDLIPFLISLLSDQKPVVRQITCWSLGRYSGWASHLDAAGKERFFLPMMDGILKGMLDPNKRVQETAASAFANLEEKANKQLENPQYCEVIAKQFAECFARYKDRNMFILYDCVQTLAEHVGPTLQTPELVHHFMPALLKRWEKVADNSMEMAPLLECLSYVTTALGNTFSPYAAPIFNRCVKIIYQNLQDSLAASKNPAMDRTDQDVLIPSLDLLSAIVQALGEESSMALVSSSQPSMFTLLEFCMANPGYDTRQSAYALLGDCAIYVFPALQPALSRLLPLLVDQLDLTNALVDAEETGYAVTNNACWSCGEIAMRAGDGMKSYVEALLQRLYAILASDKLPSTLHENAAIALGRLGNGSADMLAPHVVTFAPPLLQTMQNIDWTDEKSQAMKGFSEIVLINPQGLEQCLMSYISEIAKPQKSDTTMDPARGGPYEIFKKV
ncbi:MAG: hypothetical protein M1828_001616 [Chrysothrix sp. TS-e1954]|nr:MAG: hypothetical protein M1828_001616 [Chrysothrix sp. TS-e1954]